MSQTTSGAGPKNVRAQLQARTFRRDKWWLSPLAVFLGLTLWLLYGLIRISSQQYYFVEGYGYLTPFSSPCVSASCVPGSRHFGTWLPEFPPLLPYGILALVFLLGFRLTCYYYRKAYYRAFWLSPPACAVREPHRRYTGETRFPLIMQNLHRYFFYTAVIVSLVNTYDAIIAFWGGRGFQMGLGNLILVGNVALLWGYTISCHSCRHIVGGRINSFSRHPLRYRVWTFITKLNAKHMQLAWITLGTLAVTDAYIALVSSGTITDLRFIN